MKYSWIDEYCITKKGCEKDFKEEWGATRYMLCGKMFALRGENKSGNPIITLKLEPSYGAQLRMEYADITPGYYMNKLHWNSVLLDGTVPKPLLKEMIDESYQILLHSLPKKLQQAFTEAE
jgi:Uncharacterized protein conserved in bacteria